MRAGATTLSPPGWENRLRISRAPACCFLLFVFSALRGFAAAPLTVEVDIQPETAVVGQAIRVTLTVRGDAAMEARLEGSPPRARLLTPAGGISSSSQFSWVNGRSESSRQFFLDYLATGPGETEIPSLAVTGGGQTVRTRAVPVKIRQAAAGETVRPSQESAAAPAVLVEGRLDRRSIYLGESVTLDYILRARQAVRGVEPQRLGPVPRFVAEDIELQPLSTQRRTTDAAGRAWTEVTLIRRRLVPTEAGTLEIPAVPFQVGVEKRDRDFFGFALGGFLEKIPVLAPALRVEVKPLPEAGRPADFGGAVGRFTVRAALDRPRVKTGEAVRLDLVVEGSGPLATASAPNLVLPGGLAAFDPETKEEGTGRRTWSFPVVPQQAGRYTIDGLGFSYFDPQAGRFERARAQALQLQVDPAPGEPPRAATPAPRPGSLPPSGPTPEQDLAAVEAGARGLYARVRSWALSPQLWGGLIGLAALAGLGWLAWRRLPDWIASPAAQRSRRWRALRKRLETLRRSPPADPSETALQVLQAAFEGVELITGEPARSLDRARLEGLVAVRTGNPERAREICRLLEQAEAVRFGGRPQAEEARRLVEEAGRLFA